jgi:hypothetical protein
MGPQMVPPMVPPRPASWSTTRTGPPGLPAPVRIDPVPGTPFGIAYLGVPPTVAGQAIGSLVAGVGAIGVATIVACFGVAGARGGWGPLVAGAFAVLGALVGLGAVGLGLFALRQIRRSAGRLTGRGQAVAGIVCGSTGLGLTILAMIWSLLL